MSFGSPRRSSSRAGTLAAAVAAVLMLAGCGGSAASTPQKLPEYTPDPSFDALLNEPGAQDTLEACVDVLVLQSWAADRLQQQTPQEVAQLTDRMLAAGARASVADMGKYGDFYLDLGRPLVHIQTGDYEALMNSLASLRSQCEGFGFQYP